MRDGRIVLRPAALLLLAVLGLAQTGADLPLLVSDDFETGTAARWLPGDPARWRVAADESGRFYELTAPGTPGPVRAPTSWSILSTGGLSDFVLTGRLRCYTDPANDKRDMCVIFGFQDPAHFYYVHFAASSDGVHNVIALVNGADRIKINAEPAGKSVCRLTDKAWRRFKVEYGADGRIAAYLDDMVSPILTAQDMSLPPGRIGLGSFDDTGAFDDIVLRGRTVRAFRRP
jgi:hypothetical protein